MQKTHDHNTGGGITNTIAIHQSTHPSTYQFRSRLQSQAKPNTTKSACYDYAANRTQQQSDHSNEKGAMIMSNKVGRHVYAATARTVVMVAWYCHDVSVTEHHPCALLWGLRWVKLPLAAPPILPSAVPDRGPARVPLPGSTATCRSSPISLPEARAKGDK